MNINKFYEHLGLTEASAMDVEDAFDPGYKDRATNTQELITNCVDLVQVIECLCDWKNTKQGLGFWAGVSRTHIPSVEVREKPKASMLKTFFRYQPTNVARNTRVTWEEGDNLVELYHDESESYSHLYVDELPTIIEVLGEIYAKSKEVK